MHKHSSHPDIIKRLKRANGQINKVVAMLEDGEKCVDIAQQMQAVYGAVGKAKTALVQDHIEGCLEAKSSDKPADIKKKMKELKEITKYL